MSEEAVIPLHIDRLSHDGRGIGYIDGKIVFVDNALPGEDVELEQRKKGKRFNEGRAINILTPAPTRVKPGCDHFGVCGGCSLQHMDALTQITFKQQFLREQLKHFGACEPQTWLAPLQIASYGYRRKARIGVRYVEKKQKVLVGFREKNGRYLADITTCPVLEPTFGLSIEAFEALIGQLSNFKEIAQLEVAMGDYDAAMIIRHLSPFTDHDLSLLKTFSSESQIAIFLQPKGLDSIKKLWPADGNDFLHYSLPAFNLKFDFHPNDFTQVNLPMNRLMVDQALALLELQATDRVLDLFCGIGNFSLALATQSEFVLGVEGDALMVNRATHNAVKNGLTNVHFVAADLTQQFAFAEGLAINKVLIDPPRAGALEVLPHIIALNPEKIVYVSCNPATLARDAKVLTEAGYSLAQAGVLDMFPHTSHVESMALFVRKSATKK